MITKQILSACLPTAAHETVEKYLQPLIDTMSKYHIDTPLRDAHFIAQIGHESANFAATAENLNYSAKALLSVFPKYFTAETANSFARQPEKIANLVYANRLGNVLPGDGWRYRGRGLMQVTGKVNYAAISKDIGVDFVNHPELLEGTVYATECAGWYWNKHGINTLADLDDLVAVTKKINGGTNGLDDRAHRLELAKLAYNLK